MNVILINTHLPLVATEPKSEINLGYFTLHLISGFLEAQNVFPIPRLLFLYCKAYDYTIQALVAGLPLTQTFTI